MFIGIGFPVNEKNAQYGKSYFGFVLEREGNVAVKQEMKQEPAEGSVDDEEPTLMIDEEPTLMIDEAPEAQNNVVQIPEIDVPEPFQVAAQDEDGNDPSVIAEVNDLDWFERIEVKQEAVKHELDDDDMGTFTDDEDDDDVIFVDPVATTSTKNTESFNYLNQFSQMPGFNNDDDDGYNNTQTLLNDLMEATPPPVETNPPLPEIPVPPPPISETVMMTPPPPVVPAEAPVVITDRIPSTSATCNETNEGPEGQTPVNLVEILKETDLSVVLRALVDIHTVDVMRKAMKDIEKTDNVVDKSTNDKKRKGETKKDETSKRSSDRNSKNRSKEKKSREVKDDPKFLKEKSPPKRRDSHKDRRSSLDKDKSSTSKAASVEKRRSSARDQPDMSKDRRSSVEKSSRSKETKAVPVRRDSVHDRPGPSTEVEPVLNGEVSPEPESVAPRPVSPVLDQNPSASGTKRKADEICTSPEPMINDFHAPPAEKRRAKFDFIDSLKNLRPVPAAKNIEDIFTASQLPPPLEMVPEAKEPDFKYKLFNKKKERVAHNKVPEKDEGKPRKREAETKKKEFTSDPRKKRENGYKIPKIDTGSKITEDLSSFIARVDAAHLTKNDSSNENQKNGVVKQVNQTKQGPEGVREPSREPVAGPSHIQPSVELASDHSTNKTTPNGAVAHVFAVPALPPLFKPPPNHEKNRFIPSPIINEDPRLQNGLLPAIQRAAPMPYNCRDILKDVLSWKVEWMGEEEPPIVPDVKNLTGITRSFSSYGHYVK